jgi:hypothetical protein
MNSIDMLIDSFRKSLEEHNIKLDVQYIISQLNHEVIAARDKHKDEIVNALLHSMFEHKYLEEYDWNDVKNAIIEAERYYKTKINNSK